MEIVINKCYGGFGLSQKALDMLGMKNFYEKDVLRTDPKLIKVVRALGEEANDRFSKLEIIEVPDDVQWQIEEYDGIEWVAEKHRTWGNN